MLILKEPKPIKSQSHLTDIYRSPLAHDVLFFFPTELYLLC